MARLSFRDRFFTPPVARAVVSPSGILLAGAGAAVAIATGLPLVAAPILAIGAWGARVLVAVPKNSPQERIDPFTLPDPWRRFPREAIEARERFERAVRSADRGPLQDRLAEIGKRIEDGVLESWRIAKRGAQLAEARSHIDTATATAQLRRVEADASESWAAGSAIERTLESLRAQVETAERLDAVIDDAHNRLQLLDARLDEAVARAIELSVQSSAAVDTDPGLSGLGADVDGLVSEMEALRQALEETTHPGGTATSV